MKTRYLIPFLLLLPLLFISCTADSLQPNQVEAAEPVTTERPVKSAVAVDDGPEDLPDFPLKNCPVTQPPQERFIPPNPFPENPYPDQFYYGTDALWTALPTDQTWRQLPYEQGAGYGQKLFFQRADYYWLDEPEPAFTVTGRSLYPEGYTLTASRATNGFHEDVQSFILVGAEFPTAGCWEITGQYGEDTLTYIIWIAP